MLDSIIAKKGYYLKTEYDFLKDDYNKLENKYNNLFEINKKLEIQVGELLSWKKDHICNNDINLDIEEMSEYIKLNNINKSYSNKILQLETDIEKIQLNSKIEDNHLFKQMKKQNELLNDEILELKKGDTVKINNSDIFDKQAIIDEIKISLESNFSIEKEEIKIKYENIINGNNKIIQELNEKINSKNNKNKDKENCIKNINDSLYKSIVIYDNYDIKKPWQEEICSFTYNNLKKYILIDDYINNDKDINKDDFKQVYQWLNIYELDKEKIKNNYHIKRKIKRCRYIIEKYKEQIKYVKFNINSLSYMKNDIYDKWLDILDQKINNSNFISNNDNINYKNNIEVDNVECLDCKKLELQGLKGLCGKCYENLQNNISDSESDYSNKSSWEDE